MGLVFAALNLFDRIICVLDVSGRCTVGGIGIREDSV